MKIMKTKFTKLVTVLLLSVIIVGFSSCSKEKDGLPSTKEHKVIFKAIASSGSDLDIAVYGYDTNITTKSGLSGTTWESGEITVPKGTAQVSAQVSAMGANANSTLKVEIWIDGKLVKEGTSSGPALGATVFHIF